MKRPAKARAVVTAKTTSKSVRVYFDGHLHCFLRRALVTGLQAFKETGEEFPFIIEVTAVDGHRITLEYDRAWKWKAVLAPLNEAFERWSGARP